MEDSNEQSLFRANKLYHDSIKSVVSNYRYFKNDIHLLPVNVIFDIYYNMYVDGKLCQLGMELNCLDTFCKVLVEVQGDRAYFHQMFQALMDHGTNIAQSISIYYSNRCLTSISSSRLDLIKFGIQIGQFLSEAGWYKESQQVINSALAICTENEELTPLQTRALEFDLKCKLLSAYNSYCSFKEATALFKSISADIKCNVLENDTRNFNVATAYNEFSCLFFAQSHYDSAYSWSLEALRVLNSDIPSMSVIDVLRQASKACVAKREFKRADLLIKQALLIAKDLFLLNDESWTVDYNRIHSKIADLFIDYGFYLLNVDYINQSVKLYEMALNLRSFIFGSTPGILTDCNNLQLAIIHEDMAYASYVHEYSSGQFETARSHAEKAMTIMKKILPVEHLLTASAKRVKALILEEIAIDHHDKLVELQMLHESQILHMSALDMARNAFGEINVQTAKHYGNLGRLYQSMHRFTEAEQMHNKAIEIKEKLLGQDDYEVALSLGHLASLYNYDMMLFEKAERLYLRSIRIGIKLFGESYSGLEYDYRGLLRVYSYMSDHEKLSEYMTTLHQWKHLRDKIATEIEYRSPLKCIKQSVLLKPKQIYEALHQII